ncbi:MAG: hypothetical protein WHT22_12790 [Bacteroidales bacterium]
MKKTLSIPIFFLFSMVLVGQNTGKWVMPVTDAYTNSLTNKTLEIIFPSSGNITYNELPYARGYDNIGAYGGAYNPNFSEQKFYILGDKLYHNGTTTTWITSNANNKNFTSSFRIIPLNSEGTRFHIIYGDETTPNHNHLLVGQTTELINGTWVFGNQIELANMANPWTEPVHDYLFASFTVSPNNQGAYKLFACYGIEDLTSYELVGYSIDSNGVNPVSRTVYSTSGGSFPDLAYCSWQLSHKTNNSTGTEIFAWCSSSGWNPLYSNLLNHLFILDGSTQRELVMNYGPITGVSFSVVDPSVVYIACEGTGNNYTGRGIYKVNYITGAVLGMLAGSGEYNRSWLKKAPDGHIYAVRNDGRALGRINQQSGNFEAGIFTFPDNMKLNSYYDIITTGGVTHKLFYLPDDNRPVNTLSSTFTTTYTDPCQNTGTATVAATGGTAPYTYQWYYVDNGQPVLMPGYTTATVTNLAVGTYQCVVTDAYGYTVTVTIVITYDPNVVVSGMNYISGGTHTNETKIFEQGFIVKAGTTVTLNNCNYQFMPGAKVIVEQGAIYGNINNPTINVSGGVLILDATTFKSVPACNNRWQGIEVWGNKTAHQAMVAGKCAQGKLITRNNSVIQDAICAVALWQPGNFNTTGGIINASNTWFTNNTKSLHALEYDNYVPTNDTIIKVLVSNVSSFTNCTFNITALYIPGSPAQVFYKHVDLSKVNGLKFRGCDFSIPPGIYSYINLYNMAIGCYNAGFQLDAPCTNTTVPCTSYDRSNFNNFYTAIYAANTGVNNYTFSIIRANFNNNAIGVYVNGVKNESILFNNFYLGPNYGDNCEGGNPSYGIYLENSSGFLIEENTFQKATGAPTGTYMGVAVNNCACDQDIIYKNTFTGLSVGNYSYGINRSNPDNDGNGLSYECNHNSNNAVDFRVTGPHVDTAKIHGHIGRTTLASGNTFSSAASVSWHFMNEGGEDIRYYHYGYTNQYPTKIFTIDPNNPDNYFLRIPAPENSCPSHYGNGGATSDDYLMILTAAQKEAVREEYSLADSSYNDVKGLYDYLKDGGNTAGTKLDIETAQPNQMWQLVADLLSKSPYLSEEVLRAAADQTQVIPESELFEVLAANPDELRNNSLMDYLEQKENPLPGYMIDLLKQVALGSSAKTVLIDQMNEFNTQRVQAAQKLLRSALNDTVVDIPYIRHWLTKLNSPVGDEQIAFTYLEEGKTDSAYLVLDAIPGKYGLDGDALDEFNAFADMFTFQVQLKQMGRTIYDLDSTELAWLNTYANNSMGQAGSMARDILEYTNNGHFCHCPGSQPTWFKQSKPVRAGNNIKDIKITIKPNPADTWVVFDYQLPTGTHYAVLTIADALGKVNQTIVLKQNKGQWIWDTRQAGSGDYYYLLQAGSRQATGKIIVK